jgi:TonB family protein
MLESRLPPRRRLSFAVSLALSLILHGLAWNLLRPAGIPAPNRLAGKPPPTLKVSLATVAQAASLVETPELPPPVATPLEPSPPQNLPPARVPGTAPTALVEPAAPAAPAGLSGIVSGPWYYAARYLHRRPTPLKPIRPNYPPFTSDIAGHVVLLLLINEQGTVDTHRILQADPATIFDETVVAAFIKERYAPGLISGHPVKSQLLVEVVFEPGTEPRTGVLVEAPR